MHVSTASTAYRFLLDAAPGDTIDFNDYGAPFLTGNGFALRCKRFFSPHLSALGVNLVAKNNDAVYVKTDCVVDFYHSGFVPDRFTLVTHNSDFVIDPTPLVVSSVGDDGRGRVLDLGRLVTERILGDPRCRLWLAMNPGCDHPKLRALPVGLNSSPVIGAGPLFRAVAGALGHGPGGMGPEFRGYKTRTFHANYTIDSNFEERARCAAVCQAQGIALDGRKPFVEYLADLSASRFALCPNGGGIDSCRIWEALYLRAIPIVTPSRTVAEHRDAFPFVVVDRWDEASFRAADFTAERYETLARSFGDWAAALSMDAYCERLNRLHGVDW